jgi:ATP-dependent helicase/nuclease subunit B
MEQYIPEPDQEGMVSFPQCCLGIAHLVQNYARIHSEAEAEAAAQIRSCLEQLAQNWPVSLSCEKAWQRIQEAIEALRVQRQSPQPGCLHLASMAHAEWINRPVVFVLGLHAGALDLVTLQDPVLLDSEREQISSLLPLRRNMQSRRNYLITRFLASCRGSITLSFPCFDTVEGRACLPSALLLQVYRLISRNPLADYTAFLEWLAPASAYYPDQPANALNESEWWLSQVKSTVDAVVAQDKLLSLYPLLADGWEARQARYSEYISAYDGRLDCDGLTLDPRHNPELIMSASALEKIAKCPFGYFLQYILRVKLPQDLQADNGIWLDALNRGSLLHLIYCRYLRMVYNHNHKPDQSLLIQIASEEISQMAEEIPPPSGIVYDLEKQELLHSLDVFWSLLEEQNQAGESRPAFFEVPFGMAADEIPDAAMGQADAVAIPLPSGAYLKLRGKIDRIDIDIKGNYQVWDFKTGGLYGYAERGYTAKGQQVQHVLYSQAAEIMLSEHTGKPVQVNQAGYIFPTQKGEGQRRVRQQSSRTKGLEAVEKILDLLQTAVFHATSDSKPCTYCDYRIVSRETRSMDKKTVASEKIKSLVKGANCADLDVWKELQQYV